MPVNYTALLGQGDWDQTAIARAARASTRIGPIQGAMCGTNEELAACVKKTIGLEIHFHGHMTAPVQVGVDCSPKPNGKCSTRLAAIDDIERNRQTTIDQVFGIAQRNDGDLMHFLAAIDVIQTQNGQ